MLVWLIILSSSILLEQSICNAAYILFNTEVNNKSMDGYCLHYLVPQKGLSYQVIPYCLRFDQQSIARFGTVNELSATSLSFQDLYLQKITVDDLFKWSIPIDTIEKYASFLNNDVLNGAAYIYICKKPWFGPECRYRFHKDHGSFQEQVEKAMQRQRWDSDFNSYTISCYTHISCNRTGNSNQNTDSCLDWREICDGKIDCLDGGLDEQQCWQLEINECDYEKEYQCHNGLCIPKIFFHDDPFNADCLDRSDERDLEHIYAPLLEVSLRNCPSDPSFRCEDHLCRQPSNGDFILTCGDGTCENAVKSFCKNKRIERLYIDTIISANVNLSCSMSLACLIQPTSNHNLTTYCSKYSVKYHSQVLKRDCPSYVVLPPTLFGHVQFVYTNDQAWKTQSKDFKGYALHPDYICYDSTACDENIFDSSIYKYVNLFNDYRICYSVANDSKYLFVYGLSTSSMDQLVSIFRRCQNVNHSNFINEDLGHYRCMNSTKTISYHRLLDGIEDCLLGDDESYPFSCSLPDAKQRFRCHREDSVICLSPVLLLDMKHDCSDSSDEIDREQEALKNRLSFADICDGFTDYPPKLIDGRLHTDETECQQFPCNNINTRCNGIWNCLDGSDEINCDETGFCPKDHHICLSSKTRNLTCLPMSRVQDGIPDCFGYSDEQGSCREIQSLRYHCWDTDICMDTRNLCFFNVMSCESPLVVNSICKQLANRYSIPCVNVNRLTPIERYLCSIYPKVTGFNNFVLSDTVSSRHRSNSESNIDIKKSNAEWPIFYFNIDYFTEGYSTSICPRGVPLLKYINNGSRNELMCLCPPAYYGRFCQYQNQRVSLTLQFSASRAWRTQYTIIILLQKEADGEIESHEKLTYLAARDCNRKFHAYLLYKDRPKHSFTNYSVRVDIYESITREHQTSLIFPVKFSFLPVHRMSFRINIPAYAVVRSDNLLSPACSKHGYLVKYQNSHQSFCYCNSGWTNNRCSRRYTCECSSSSVCLNPSICLCQSNRFGPRCALEKKTCPCLNGGSCDDNDERISSEEPPKCYCPDGYSGRLCEHSDTKIIIKFRPDINIPRFILVHYIEVFDRETPHKRTSTSKKIGFDEDQAILYKSEPFHLIFVELNSKMYYLVYLEEFYSYEKELTVVVDKSKVCQHLQYVLDVNITSLDLIRRMKYYHVPCRAHLQLKCFYDEHHICLCHGQPKQVNCVPFNQNSTYDCDGRHLCENDGSCFQDKPRCPTKTICVCPDCYFGSRCQFTTKGFDLSLDLILSYQIRSDESFLKQSIPIQIVTGVFIVILASGLTSSILSISTFQIKRAREVGCGIYLLVLSCISMILVILIGIKYILTLLLYMSIIDNAVLIVISCKLLNYLIRVFSSSNDWLAACVNVERVVSAFLDLNFNKQLSKRVAKWISVGVFTVVGLSYIQDPMHYRLVKDSEEGKQWCIAEYNGLSRTMHTAILFFHFLVPFMLNICSAILIIYRIAVQQYKTRNKKSFGEYLRSQFYKFKHLLISPSALVCLALPRLIMSFFSGCMKSARDPWIFLVGHILSYIPPALVFLIFILPSRNYRSLLGQFLKKLLARSHGS